MKAPYEEARQQNTLTLGHLISHSLGAISPLGQIRSAPVITCRYATPAATTTAPTTTTPSHDSITVHRQWQAKWDSGRHVEADIKACSKARTRRLLSHGTPHR